MIDVWLGFGELVMFRGLMEVWEENGSRERNE